MMPEIASDRRADEVGAEFKDGVVVEVGCQPLLRQLDAIALDAGKADFERVALGADGLDLNRLARRLRRGDDRLRREVEGNAEDVGVFHVEQSLVRSFFVQLVGLAAQRATNNLLAQKLGAEGANAENVGDGIGIPAFGEHRDGDDAADRTAKLAGLADSVHDLAEQFLVGDVFAGTGVAGALDDFAAKAFNLVGSHATKVVVERIARFELLAIDEQRVRARQRIAGGFVEIAEQCEAPVLQGGGAVFVLAVEAGDEIVNELRDRGVLADDDEAGRHLDALVLPKLEGLLHSGRRGLPRPSANEWGVRAGRVLRLCRAPSWACRCGCSPRGCGTLASRCREYFPRLGRAAA